MDSYRRCIPLPLTTLQINPHVLNAAFDGKAIPAQNNSTSQTTSKGGVYWGRFVYMQFDRSLHVLLDSI